MYKDATIVGPYRYSLTREWDASKPRVVFIMLNPSTADDDQDDNSVKRCIGFAKKWGFGSLEVVNLFAYRTPNPEKLSQVEDPVGMENREHIGCACKLERLESGWKCDA
ncbi:DUF1643 domain-containing protein [Kyrpidia sp.]|uniref:DUF1643 domain-containing protein n=1 Tax=Kyrpidia sp. TaxID=2073077 RepID=UPI00258DDF1B|nr:DUF1643 domain-containing protein [Kyrpidia sp.]MCL6576102.1 DUF1643 domain-containing protein [Kyrpidia sp.]